MNVATDHVNGKRSETITHIATAHVYRVFLSNFIIAFVARNCGSNFLIALHGVLLQSINLLTRARIAIIVSLPKDPLSFSPVSLVAKRKFNLPHSNLIEINNDDAFAS